MSRLVFLTFFGKPRTHAAEHAHESVAAMTFPLWVLAILSIVALVLGLPGHGPLAELFGKFTEPVFGHATERLVHVQHLPATPHEGYGLFVGAWFIALSGTVVAFFMYLGPARELPGKLARAFPSVYQFAYDKFRVDELYEVLVIEPLRFTAYILWRIVDVFAVDGILVNGTARAVGWFGTVVRFAQNGDVQRYAAMMTVAAAVILFSILGVGGR
jgi:NADH-quinone oxidoreductase subunit L